MKSNIGSRQISLTMTLETRTYYFDQATIYPSFYDLYEHIVETKGVTFENQMYEHEAYHRCFARGPGWNVERQYSANGYYMHGYEFTITAESKEHVFWMLKYNLKDKEK